MTEEKYTVSLTEDQVLMINSLVCDEGYHISNRILALDEGKEKDCLRNQRDRLMELNDAFMDAILDIMRKYEDEAKKNEG